MQRKARERLFHRESWHLIAWETKIIYPKSACESDEPTQSDEQFQESWPLASIKGVLLIITKTNVYLYYHLFDLLPIDK